MNIIISFGVMSSMFVSVIYCQYYPHRSPIKQQPYIYSAKDNQNPFQTAHENEGYYQRFTDYGSQRTKPLTQTQNTYSSDNKGRGKAGKSRQNQDNYEDNAEYDFETNLDYNDVTGGKDFDPFKFVSDGVSGVGDFADFGGLEDSGDHFDYNTDFNSEN